MGKQRKGGAVKQTTSIYPNTGNTLPNSGVLIQPIPDQDLTVGSGLPGVGPHPSNSERLEEGKSKAAVDYFGRKAKTIPGDSPGGRGTFEPRTNTKFR